MSLSVLLSWITLETAKTDFFRIRGMQRHEVHKIFTQFNPTLCFKS